MLKRICCFTFAITLLLATQSDPIVNADTFSNDGVSISTSSDQTNNSIIDVMPIVCDVVVKDETFTPSLSYQENSFKSNSFGLPCEVIAKNKKISSSEVNGELSNAIAPQYSTIVKDEKFMSSSFSQ